MITATPAGSPPAALYRAGAAPAFIDVPPMTFLMIDGAGDPNSSPEYRDAISALYTLSYGLKFAVKRSTGLDYHVGPLEGLWWADDMTTFSADDKADWRWTMMIAQPEAVTPALFEAVLAGARKKKPLAALDDVRLEVFEEGRSAQVLHVGSYATEGPTIARLHAFIAEHGGSFDGRSQRHHEIYLSDPSRTPAERLKTIVRQPIT
jgi:hypothetical protein